MPLITDRETIDYIACVANAVVNVLEPPYSDIEWEMAIFDFSWSAALVTCRSTCNLCIHMQLVYLQVTCVFMCNLSLCQFI